MIKLSILHAFLAILVFALLIWAGADLSGFGYFWGAALSGSQMLFLVALGYRIIYKKGIALTLIISVFKYGILLGIFILAGAGMVRITPSFAIGCISIVASLTSLIFLRPYVLKGME